MFKTTDTGQAAALALDPSMFDRACKADRVDGDPAALKLPKLPPAPPKLSAQIISFGGRQRRYQVQRGMQVRVFDPIAQRYVVFGHERYYLAWLNFRFDPLVRGLSEAPEPLSYLWRGERVTAKPHLRWLNSAGEPVLFWLAAEWPQDKRDAYERFGSVYSARVNLWTWEDLADIDIRLENLQSARQLMTNAAQANTDLRGIARRILGLLSLHGVSSRGELGAELCCQGCLKCPLALDAALFHLHANGAVDLDLDSAPFGDETVVARL